MDVLLGDPLLLVWLAVLGLCTGFLTGLFGIGGAFVTTPVMIAVIGIDSSLAVGCSMGFTLVNGIAGLRRHSGVGQIETRALLVIGAAACLGTFAGFQFHYSIKQAMGERFPDFVNALYIAILLPIGLLVWWQSNKTIGRPLLSRFRIPPVVLLRQPDLPPVSLTLLGMIGLAIGIAKGMLGIGGGIILVPMLVLVVGLAPSRAVGVSLGMVVLSSIVGTALYAWRGDVNPFIVGAMLVGSLIGVGLGSRLCHISSPTRHKRMLALLILGFAAFLIFELWI